MKTPGEIHIGDMQILHAVYDRYFRLLCFYGRRYLPEMVEVEDIVQDLFVDLYQRGMRFANEKALAVYLHRCIYNACLNKINSANIRKRHREIIADILAEEHADPSVFNADVVEDNLLWKIMQAVDQLPPQCANVFRLSYVERLSINEVAERLGISANTVNSQRTRAKKLLQQLLKDIYPIAAIFLHLN